MEKNQNARTLGSVIKRGREELGLSVRGLAAAVQVAPSSILRLESDEYRPTEDLLRRLAATLDADFEELDALATKNLPRLAPYLRAKYDLPPEAIADLERHFDQVTKEYWDRDGGMA